MSDHEQIQSIDKEIEALQAKKRALLEGKHKEALHEVRQTIRSFGFSASELGLGASSGRKREPKYANPANPSQTWAGGARPKWVQEHLGNGGTLEQLLIRR